MPGIMAIDGVVRSDNTMPGASVHYEISKKDDNTILVVKTSANQVSVTKEVTKDTTGVFDLSPYTDNDVSFNVYLTGRRLQCHLGGANFGHFQLNFYFSAHFNSEVE